MTQPPLDEIKLCLPFSDDLMLAALRGDKTQTLRPITKQKEFVEMTEFFGCKESYESQGWNKGKTWPKDSCLGLETGNNGTREKPGKKYGVWVYCTEYPEEGGEFFESRFSPVSWFYGNEPLVRVPVKLLRRRTTIVANLRWLIPLALDKTLSCKRPASVHEDNEFEVY